MDKFLAAYIEAALWSTTLDTNYTVDDIDPESLEFMRQDCARFKAQNAADLEGIHDAQAGHDFWLTRNRHGAGFWDRGLGVVGDRLTNACYEFGESDVYVGDDGKVHVIGYHESPEAEAAWRLSQQAHDLQSTPLFRGLE
jgi:hypothetical protein